MTKPIVILMGLFLALFAVSIPVYALEVDGQVKFDQAMQPIVTEYLKITQALAADKTEGVADAAAKIAQLGKSLDTAGVPPEHAKHYQSMATNIPAAAGVLAGKKDIVEMRTALKDLSRPMAMWVEHADKPTVNAVFCPMANAPWLQTGKDIRNPYYGKKMLTCGEFIAGPDAAGKSKHAAH